MTEEWKPVYAGGPMKSDTLFHPVLDRYRDLAERERRLGVLPGTPILVDPMRVIDDRLIRFFNSLTWRSQCRGTRDTYKTVYPPFFEWMASQRRDVFSATDEDVGLWKILRTDREVNPTGAVEGATWNKEIAGLNVFFRWASHPARGYLPVNPLAGLPSRGRVNTGKGRRPATPAEQRSKGVRFVAKNAREYRGKWLSPATYLGWRDIGLLGYRMEPGEKQGKYRVGLPDPNCRVRNKERNRAYVDLAINTGLRRTENTWLLVCELPPQQVDEPVEFWLSPAIAKGGNGRMVLETAGAALALHKYLMGERRDAIANARAARRYESGDWLLVESVHRSAQHGLRVKWADGGRYASVDSVPPATRARLLIRTDDGVEPMALWLTERGVPMDTSAWDAVFKTANKRYAAECRRVSVPLLSVSAHALRFSYALMYLIALHRHIDKIEGYSSSDSYDYTRYHRAYRRVQFQLGHKDLTTTRQRYLEAIVDMRDDDLLLGAAGDLGATLVALAERTSLVRADADE